MPAGAQRERWRSAGARFDNPVVCPAGMGYMDAMKGPACRCRIERSDITSVEQPTTLLRFCQGEYRTCPTWRADKEAHWASRETLIDHPGRPGRTVLDEDPERRDEFVVPRE